MTTHDHSADVAAVAGTVAIVQARMGSTRCPGKVLARARGATMLAHLVGQLRHAHTIGQIVVATGDDPANDPIAVEAASLGVSVFRGSESDVLARYAGAATTFGAHTVVRITADCPLVDPAIVDQAVETFRRIGHGVVDLVTNRHPLTFPDGMDVDVMSATGLAEAARVATDPTEREHVIPYFWQQRKRVHNIVAPDIAWFGRYRWTIDYPEDVALVTAIIEGLPQTAQPFRLGTVRAFVDAHPEIAALNAHHLPH